MKVIFLDMDGVLVTWHSLNKKTRPSTLDSRCVSHLNDLLDSTGAKLVLSSQWRTMGLSAVNQHLLNSGVHDICIDQTPLHYDRHAIEIKEWLMVHRHEVQSFVILDDEGSMDELQPKLIQTTMPAGLLGKDVHLAREILMEGVDIHGVRSKAQRI